VYTVLLCTQLCVYTHSCSILTEVLDRGGYYTTTAVYTCTKFSTRVVQVPRVGGALKATDRARPLLIPYMLDWAILGLEASVIGVLTGHPAVS
jgi:hypothetical protein